MAFANTIVARFPSHAEAGTVVRELQQQSFDLQKLSFIGKDYQTSEHSIECDGYFGDGEFIWTPGGILAAPALT